MDNLDFKIFAGLIEQVKADIKKAPKELLMMHAPVLIGYVVFQILEKGLLSSGYFAPVISLCLSIFIYRFVGFISLGATTKFLASGADTDIPVCTQVHPTIKRRIEPLTIASLKTSVFVFLGSLVLLVPGFYLATIYLFIPMLLVGSDDIDVNRSIERSKEIVRSKLWEILLIELGMFLAAALIASWAMLLFSPAAGPMGLLSMIFMLPVVLILWTIHDVVLVRIFFRLKDTAEVTPGAAEA